MASFVFVCDFGVKGNFIEVIFQRLSHVLEFTAVDPLSVVDFTDLCYELTGPYESHFLLPM